MSYDLFLKSRHSALTDSQFFAWFDGRPCYSRQKQQMYYQNENTGVYFSIEFIAKDFETGDESEYPIFVNINYCRPSYFILEAELEITALVRELDLVVNDSQADGMGVGEYVPSELISGWNTGNKFGYQVMASTNSSAATHLPTEQLHKAWKWNFQRANLQNTPENVDVKYLPPIYFFSLGGKTVTAALWPDGLPIVVERTDYLCIPRQTFAPTRWFKKQEDVTFIPWEEAAPVFDKYGQWLPNGLFSLNYAEAPSDVKRFVQKLSAYTQQVRRLAPDSVLDTELVENALRKENETKLGLFE